MTVSIRQASRNPPLLPRPRLRPRPLSSTPNTRVGGSAVAPAGAALVSAQLIAAGPEETLGILLSHLRRVDGAVAVLIVVGPEVILVVDLQSA